MLKNKNNKEKLDLELWYTDNQKKKKIFIHKNRKKKKTFFIYLLSIPRVSIFILYKYMNFKHIPQFILYLFPPFFINLNLSSYPKFFNATSELTIILIKNKNFLTCAMPLTA